MTKNKPKNLFAYKKDIIAEKKNLVSLNKRKREIQEALKNMLDMYKLPPEIAEQLYVLSIDKLFDEQKEIGQDDMSCYLEIKERIRKEHKTKINELTDILNEIKISKINLTLAKIKCIEKELSKADKD